MLDTISRILDQCPDTGLNHTKSIQLVFDHLPSGISYEIVEAENTNKVAPADLSIELCLLKCVLMPHRLFT